MNPTTKWQGTQNVCFSEYENADCTIVTKEDK